MIENIINTRNNIIRNVYNNLEVLIFDGYNYNKSEVILSNNDIKVIYNNNGITIYHLALQIIDKSSIMPTTYNKLDINYLYNKDSITSSDFINIVEIQNNGNVYFNNFNNEYVLLEKIPTSEEEYFLQSTLHEMFIDVEECLMLNKIITRIKQKVNFVPVSGQTIDFKYQSKLLFKFNLSGND